GDKLWAAAPVKLRERLGKSRVDLVKGLEVAIHTMRATTRRRRGEPLEQFVGALRLKYIVPDRALRLCRHVCSTSHSIKRHAIRKSRVGIGPMPHIIVPLRKQLLRILSATVVEQLTGDHINAVLMLAQTSGVVRIKAAEMHKPQRATAHAKLTVTGFELTRVEIPVGNIVTRIAYHSYAFEETWDQIHPTLIDEHSPLRCHEALVLKTLGPPAQHGVDGWTAGERDEAKVVGAR